MLRRSWTDATAIAREPAFWFVATFLGAGASAFSTASVVKQLGLEAGPAFLAAGSVLIGPLACWTFTWAWCLIRAPGKLKSEHLAENRHLQEMSEPGSNWSIRQEAVDRLNHHSRGGHFRLGRCLDCRDFERRLAKGEG